MGNPSFSSLTPSFVLSLQPYCSALSSQHPSPINPPFSLLTLLIWLVKTGVSGMSKTLIFWLSTPPPPSSPRYVCHGSGAAFMLPLSWLLEVSHAWSPQGSIGMLLYCKYSLLSLLSICQHACTCTVHICTQAQMHFANRGQTVIPWACHHICPPPFLGVWMEECSSG